MKFSKPLSLLLVIFFTPHANAELYECGGTWTNKSCDEQPLAKLEERPLRTRSQAVINADKKKLLLHDLQTLRLRAKREFDVSVTIQEAEEICSAGKTSVLSCSKVVASKEKELNQLILEYENLTEKKAKEEAKQDEEHNDVVVVPQRRRRADFIGVRPNPLPKPGPQPMIPGPGAVTMPKPPVKSGSLSGTLLVN